MTEPRTTFWEMCFAVAWFHAPSRISAGVVHDHERAAIAANEADRMVKAVQSVRPEMCE